MSMFILAISCLTTSNLLWFTDLTFQVSIHIVLYSIKLAFHHQTQPQPQRRVISALGQMLLSFWCFFLAVLVIVLPSPSVAYWTSSILGVGDSSSRVLSFCLFILFMGVFMARILEWVAIPSFGEAQCQDSSPWLTCLRWPCTAWVIAWVIQAPPPWQGCDPWRGVN